MPYFPPIQQDQYPATDEVQCIEVKIPAGDEFKALLAGLMVAAADVNSYADPDSAQADGLAAIWDQAYSEIDWEGCPVLEANMPTIDLFCINAAPYNGVGTLTPSFSASLPFAYAQFTANTTLHGMEQSVWLPGGNYDYIGWSTRSTAGGNTTVVLLDAGGSVIQTFVSLIAQNGTFGTLVKSTASITVPADDEYRVVVRNSLLISGNQANWISHHLRRTS